MGEREDAGVGQVDPTGPSDGAIVAPASSDPPATPPPGLPAASWKPEAKLAVGCGSGCGLLILLQGLAVYLALSPDRGRPPEGVQAEARTPPAPAGQPRPLTLIVRNRSGRTVRLSTLTAGTALKRRLRLGSPTPAPTRPPADLLGTTMWTYDRRLGSGEKWEVTFQATPPADGPRRGAFEVSVNGKSLSIPFELEGTEENEAEGSARKVESRTFPRGARDR